MRKKRILFLSDYAGAFTGFGKQCKFLLTYLYGTGKYEILNAAQGSQKQGRHTEKFPWKTIGVLPVDPAKIQKLNQDPNMARMASYGNLELNSIVKEFKPDIVFSVNDTWGSQFVTELPFFKKIPTVCWNTFDSLPLLSDTINKANKIKHYWTWSDFARKELHKNGHTHVKNQYPLVNTKNFYKLPNQKISEIKHRFGLPQDSFIIGFVFRNQLRKLINTQIEAYAMFRKANPEVKNTYLYTHTHYGEGWDIRKLCKQYSVDPKEVLCTYICKETLQYFISPFQGQDIENPVTKNKSLVTTNVNLGVSDEQLNEIYNIFSLYSHPATSGACELPCVEAALTEKIITTAPYSFGEDIIELNKGSIAMKFNFYTEHGTQFLKSQPSPHDISRIFKKVYEMKPQLKLQMEKDSRTWALDNYSIEVNGKKIENFIDEIPLLSDEDFDFTELTKNNPNPDAVITDYPNNLKWVKSLYKLILDNEVTDQDEGVTHWLQKLQQNVPKDQIVNYFRHVAKQELEKNNTKKVELKDLFSKYPNHKKVLIVQPDSITSIFLLTALFESIRDRYPEDKYKIYVATDPDYQDLIFGNPFIDEWIPYNKVMDSAILIEGALGNDRICDIVYNPRASTQLPLSYTHNGEDKIDLELCTS